MLKVRRTRLLKSNSHSVLFNIHPVPTIVSSYGGVFDVTIAAKFASQVVEPHEIGDLPS